MSHRLVFILYRRPELDRQAFQHYWTTTHAPLVKSVARTLGITGYQQVHTVGDGPGDATSFDGVAELWFDPAAAEGTADERRQAGTMLLEDEARFIDLAASPIFLGEEREVSNRHREGKRTTSVVYRKAGTTRAQFRAHWGDVHGPLVVAHPEVFNGARYVQVHAPDNAETYPAAIARNAPPPPDGVAETYFADLANVAPELRDPVLAELVTDTAKFVDTDRSVSAPGRVDVIIGHDGI